MNLGQKPASEVGWTFLKAMNQYLLKPGSRNPATVDERRRLTIGVTPAYFRLLAAAQEMAVRCQQYGIDSTPFCVVSAAEFDVSDSEMWSRCKILAHQLMAAAEARDAEPRGTKKSKGTSAEPHSDKTPAPGDANATDDPLCDRAQIILQVLWKKKAVDSDSRLSTADIVASAGGTDSVPYKPVVADLCRRGYVGTKQGSGGGVWLTQQGKDRAAKL